MIEHGDPALTTSTFEHAGVIEGFYGPAWQHLDRLYVIERIGHWGMNRYVYAPKDDPLHRSRWRDPYPEATLREFRELVECGEKAGVQVGFALSPGLSVRYSSAEDRSSLIAKFAAFAELGARSLTLALDDVPARLTHTEDQREFDSLGAAHVALAEALRDSLAASVSLFVIPTDYLGVEPTDYLATLGAGLDPQIEIGWTGRTIVSPTITTDEAEKRSQTLQRRVLIWDNVPVSDGSMRSMLHMGPYKGRDPGLPEFASGILLNPMEHARASCVALHTAAAYMADPTGYDPESAWFDALEELGAGATDAFRLFAEAHRFSPLHPDDRDRDLEARVAEISVSLGNGQDFSDALVEARDMAAARLGVADRLRDRLSDRRLLSEIEPWVDSHEVESRRIHIALDTLLNVVKDVPRSEQVFAVMRMQGQLTLDAFSGHVSYGPRRVLYPQLTSMRDDQMSLGAEPALFRDRCLADDIIVLVEDLALFMVAGER